MDVDKFVPENDCQDVSVLAIALEFLTILLFTFSLCDSSIKFLDQWFHYVNQHCLGLVSQFDEHFR